MATLTVYPDADPESTSVDGRVLHVDNGGIDWADLIAGVGTSAEDNAEQREAARFTAHGSLTDKWRRLIRSIILFDTSALGAGASISATTLSLFGQNVSAPIADLKLNIYSSAPASNTALVAGDFNSLGSTAYSDAPIASGDWNGTGYNDFALNATGLAAISKTGITKFGTREVTYDVGAAVPAWAASRNINFPIYYAEETEGDERRPKLVITYTVAPTVTTQTMQDVAGTTATGRGTITDLGDPNPTAHGHCWDTSTDPTTSDSVVDNGAASATGEFTSSLTDLTPGTGYYSRPYATNTAGTSYGANTFFIADAPMVTTLTCKDVVGATATGRGNIITLNGTVTAHGHCWNTTVDPTTGDSSVDNGATAVTGGFTSAITGLTPGTAIYTRAFATNENGTGYGDNVYFLPPKTGTVGRAGYMWKEGSNEHIFDENAIEQILINQSDVDDTPVDGATTDPISSNWAYDNAILINDNKILAILGLRK